MKRFNDEKQMRSDWTIPLCTGAERIKLNGVKAHATQKPEALLYRVLLASSNPGDVVLDPFFGTGTTGAVAKQLKRHYIGIEREAVYIDVAQARIAAIAPITMDETVYDSAMTRRTMPRLPFGALLEAGLLRPGQVLYFNQRLEAQATIMADGSLRTPDGMRGSIHQIAAHVAQMPTCNGWDRWYYENEHGQLAVIDVLRTRLRQHHQTS